MIRPCRHGIRGQSPLGLKWPVLWRAGRAISEYGALARHKNKFGLGDMRYFKRYWDEPRGDAHNNWGCSWWYFEVDDAGVLSRQIEVYDHGPTLRYHDGRLDDEFGGLTDQPLDLSEFAVFTIGPEEFEQVWATGRE